MEEEYVKCEVCGELCGWSKGDFASWCSAECGDYDHIEKKKLTQEKEMKSEEVIKVRNNAFSVLKNMGLKWNENPLRPQHDLPVHADGKDLSDDEYEELMKVPAFNEAVWDLVNVWGLSNERKWIWCKTCSNSWFEEGGEESQCECKDGEE